MFWLIILGMILVIAAGEILKFIEKVTGFFKAKVENKNIKKLFDLVESVGIITVTILLLFFMLLIF